MANYKTAFGNFVKTEDLGGRAVPVTIEHVALEDIKSDRGVERKLVASFVGKSKKMVVNLTNAEMLARVAGTEDFEDWAGTHIILAPATTKFGGKTVPCLRFQAPKGHKSTVIAEPEPEVFIEPDADDEVIPF